MKELEDAKATHELTGRGKGGEKKKKKRPPSERSFESEHRYKEKSVHK